MKTRNQVEYREAKSAFMLQHMVDIYSEQTENFDIPHRHSYYTVILVDHADGEHMIDFKTHRFGQREVHFVSPGQIHQVRLTKPPHGWVITFSRDFLAENSISEEFISGINLFYPFGESPPLILSTDSFEKLRSIAKDMKSCNKLENRFQKQALSAWLQLFLIYCYQSCTLDISRPGDQLPSSCILREFKLLVEREYIRWHQVRYYAEKMHLSAKHLSQTVKQLTGRTAKQMIQDRILLEAKRQLIHTSMPIKEIAYKLGYEDALHFSAFFKNKTNHSPSLFRKTYKQHSNT